MSHHLTSPRMMSLAVVTLGAAISTATAGGPAYAASGNLASTTYLICLSAPSPALCQESFRLVVPETIQVTVDKHNPSTRLYSWTITDSHGIVRCSQSYRASDPPRTWPCTLPAGISTFRTSTADGPTFVTLTY